VPYFQLCRCSCNSQYSMLLKGEARQWWENGRCQRWCFFDPPDRTVLTHYISWQSVVVRGDRTRLSVVSCSFMPYPVEELHQSSAVEPRQHLRSASTSLLVVWQKSLNPRWSSFSGRCCPIVEHSATESHVGVVNICFQETFKDPSLQSFFPQISCSACAVTLSFWTL